MDMGEPEFCYVASASGSNRSATPSHITVPETAAHSRPVQRLRPRKGIPQRCLQGDCFLDFAAPLPLPTGTGAQPLSKQGMMQLQHNAIAYNDPPYAPPQKRKAAVAQSGYPLVKASTRAQRRREEMPFSRHDSSGDLDAAANVDGETGVRRSKRQRRTVAGFEGYNESLSLELSAEELGLLEEEEEPVPHTSHVFQSREEALAVLAADVMKTAGVQSFRICLELANDLARYKHPPLQDWPRYTPHIC